MPSRPKTVGLIFNLAPDATMAQALRALSAAKIEVATPLEEIGMILGSGHPSQLSKLRRLPVFQSVDIDSSVQLAPPDSPIQ